MQHRRQASRTDQKASSSVPRSTAENILNARGLSRPKLPQGRPAGVEVAPKIGSLGPGDLEVQGTQSSFARDSLYHALAEKTHTEIFKTDKDAVKKQINYSNYSLHPSHLISNKPMGDDRVMGLYVNDKIMDYKTPYVEDLQSSIRDHNAQIN